MDCLFSYSRVVRVLYIFWIQILCICITNISFQFLAYFITNVFWKTVDLILINSNPSAFIFLLWLFIYFLFSVKNHCLQQSCEDFLLSFVRSHVLCCSFMSSCMTNFCYFSSIIYDRKLRLIVFIQIYNGSITICHKDSPSPIDFFWYDCEELIDCICMGLFLDSLFYFFDCLSLIAHCFITLAW